MAAPATVAPPKETHAIRIGPEAPVDLVALWHDGLLLSAPPHSALALNGTPLVPTTTLEGVNLVADPGFFSTPLLWKTYEAGARVVRDARPNQRIAGGHTASLRLDADKRRGLEPAVATYASALAGPHIPLFGARRVRWSALVAAQNAVFSIRLAFFDAGGKLLLTTQGSAPAEAVGGRNPRAYARIGAVVELPTDAHTAVLSAQVRPVSPADVSIGFLADIAFGAIGNPCGALADCEVPVGELYRELTSAQRVLYRASFPPVSPGSAPRPLVLDVNGTTLPIGALSDLSGTVNSRFVGGAIHVEPLAVDGRLTVLADGDFVAEIHGAAEQPGLQYVVNAPPDCLDGQPHTIEVVSSRGRHALTVGAVRPTGTPWETVVEHVPPPVPGEGAPLAAFRYEALVGWAERSAAGAVPNWLGQHIKALHDVMVSGPDHASAFALSFPEESAPDATVIIVGAPTDRNVFFTLASLLFAPVDAALDVIVVARAKTPVAHAGVRVVIHEGRDAAAANAGAAAARAPVLVHLAAGTEVTAGWLDALLEALAGPHAILAGPRRLRPDGRLLDVGGAFTPNLEPQPAGRGANPFDPRYAYTRAVDYVPWGALAVRADAHADLGGFCEDGGAAELDLALRVRERGDAVVAVPAATVVAHVDGAPRHVALVQRRWSALRPLPLAPHLAHDRSVTARVLVVLAELPRVDADAGSVAALEEMAMIQALGAKVTLLTGQLDHFPRYADVLSRMGVELIHTPFYPSIDAFVADRGDEFDAVFVTKFEMLERMRSALMRHAPQAKILLNLADLHFLREFRAVAGDVNAGDAARAQAEEVRLRELSAIRAADVVCTYSAVEASVILSHAGPDTKTATLPWVQRLGRDPCPFLPRAGLAFLGNYRHPPNGEAVKWFGSHVMPLLHDKLPGAAFHVYGAHADVLGDVPGVAVEGYAADLDEMFAQHRIAVMPLRSGAGVKGKVFAALAAGIPVVCTEIAAEGIAVRDGEHVLLAQSPEDFVSAIATLYTDEAFWQALSENGRALMVREYGFEPAARAMQRVFEAVGLYLPLDPERVSASSRQLFARRRRPASSGIERPASVA